jgi:hypothetical protein
MQRFQLLKETLAALPYWRMEPHNELAVGGPCLARPGEVYAFYLEGTHITVNLRELEDSGKVAAWWVNTWTGARENAIAGSAAGIHLLKKPEAFGNAPAVLIVKQTGESK